jgi:hypothetical protein
MKRVVLALLITIPVLAQETRLASDFEIAQMEKQLASTHSFEAQLSGRLNLGDVRLARSEVSLARTEYQKAYAIASEERLDARRASSLSRYANATSYAALAAAKSGRNEEAFTLLEETTRYVSDDAETWNLYASAMRIAGKPAKAVHAARNAVALAARDLTSTRKRLDLAVYQHGLAAALLDAGQNREAESLLASLTETLRSPAFDSLRREVSRSESFEIYSSARGDVAAYVSLLNRAELRLASLYETRGDIAKARAEYARVLESRSDDVTALAALARLGRDSAEVERHYAEAFEANPFSMTLVREYQTYLAAHHVAVPADESTDESTGAQMRRSLVQLSRSENRAARTTLARLIEKFPANETLKTLQHEASSPTTLALPSATPTTTELRNLLDFESLTPEQRAQLDQMTFTSPATFAEGKVENGQTILESGTIESVPFRFSEPTIFAGAFDTAHPLRLTYRILGATRVDDSEALLVEPVRLEPAR